MSGPETYEVLALKYGTMEGRMSQDNFITPDIHNQPMPIDYFVWVIRNDNRTFVVDTGFNHEEAEKRGRIVERLPREALEMVGVNAGEVEDVIVTHLHYDHAGTLEDFPNARFHLQEKEMRYATGRHMGCDPLGHAYSADHVCDMVRKVFDKQVDFYDGAGEVAPGVEVHLIGGHTMGVQCVRVMTQRGWLVLASDATHFYDNLRKTSPFPIVYHVGDMIDGYGKMRALAESEEHIIPGHDPMVMNYYSAPDSRLDGVVVRLDAEPVG